MNKDAHLKERKETRQAGRKKEKKRISWIELKQKADGSQARYLQGGSCLHFLGQEKTGLQAGHIYVHPLFAFAETGDRWASG